ncbi:WbqC family protein [Winogradskyella sp. F6397]|uniref:WbqC family protein n=1 Tax=Winogradskyella marina TaxID=2785530 RepID=A0ABS0EKM0_9FLAO|nr:WbqC family protein [Winogradskyella marina]MBF8150973.1 WbqC family protein [Winogradskyella marina]
MKVAVMQPYIFPYIGYFQMVNASDIFVFYDNVDYIQRGYINRNNLLSGDGKQYFTVPVKKSSLGTKVNEVVISDYGKWKVKFLKQIKFTYSKAPFFNDIYDILENFLENKKYDKISDFSLESVIMISNYLEMRNQFAFSSEIEGLSEFDDKVEKLEHILNNYKASEIILPPGSKELYKYWEPINAKKSTLKAPEIKYKQFNFQFVENLSIIDVLMFNEIEKVKSFIENVNYQ